MTANLTVIDSRGLLFGRFNLIDAAAVILIAATLLAGSLAYASIRSQAPVITAVTPSILIANAATRVRLDGRDFRPFLHASVARRGADSAVAARPAQFLIGTASVVELLLPLLEPGTYDIHLYDGSQEVARRESALTIRRGPS